MTGAQPLCEEYEAPENSPIYTGNPYECYIEGKQDQRFAVHVELPQGYDGGGYHAVSIDITIDDDISAGHPLGINKTKKTEMDFTTYKTNKNRNAVKVPFAFDLALDRIGSIVVKIRPTMDQFIPVGEKVGRGRKGF